MKLKPSLVGPPKMDVSWWRFWQNVVHWRREWQTTSIFLPWEHYEQYEKAKRYDTERWTPQVSRYPICYWRRALSYSFLNPEPLSCSKRGSNGCKLKLKIFRSFLYFVFLVLSIQPWLLCHLLGFWSSVTCSYIPIHQASIIPSVIPIQSGPDTCKKRAGSFFTLLLFIHPTCIHLIPV